MSEPANDCAVKIAMRERPMRENSRNEENNIVEYHTLPNIVVIDERPFTFDCVFGPEISQQQLFDDLIQPLVAKVKQGFNCTALAYGQTGTGKSYTMGINSNGFEGEHVGIIPRCLKNILSSTNDENIVRRDISASYIEIYNEKLYDLLAENCTESIPARGYKYTGGVRKYIKNLQDCYDVLINGVKKRHVRPTKMNSQSSRSHAIFTIHITTIYKEQMTSSCLNLVDLAGSEGVRRTGHQGVAMSEGVHINQGLLSISKVLQAMTLCHKVIPYRDSVLTSVLQESLNSNSYLTLLACISPNRGDLSETLSTLRFAQNAKQLKHTPQINAILNEIRKNKSKTPYKVTPLQQRNAPTPFKRPLTTTTTVPNSVSKGNGFYSKTFCTPSKMKRTDSNKLNHTEMGATLKEKEKTQMGLVRPMIMKPPVLPVYPLETANNRESLFDHTIDSRASLASFNVSTSTTIDGPSTQNTSSYSPVVRRCITEFEAVMENKMLQMLDVLKGNMLQHSIEERRHTPTTPAVPIGTQQQQQQLPTSIRNEIKSIMRDLLAESANSKPICTLPSSTPDMLISPKQLFSTSSPEFKLPNIPIYVKDMTEISQEEDSIMVLESTTEGMTMVRNTVRRSCRIAERTHNISTTSEDTFVVARRRSLRKSTKQMYDEKRRLTLVQSKVPESKPARKTINSKRPAAILDNSLLASYFINNDTKTASSTSKKPTIAKHRKAILDLLNKGSMKQLQLLPQIGQKTAFQIVTQRTLSGKFKSLVQVEKLPIWRGNGWERFAKANMLM